MNWWASHDTKTMFTFFWRQYIKVIDLPQIDTSNEQLQLEEKG